MLSYSRLTSHHTSSPSHLSCSPYHWILPEYHLLLLSVMDVLLHFRWTTIMSSVSAIMVLCVGKNTTSHIFLHLSALLFFHLVSYRTEQHLMLNVVMNGCKIPKKVAWLEKREKSVYHYYYRTHQKQSNMSKYFIER